MIKIEREEKKSGIKIKTNKIIKCIISSRFTDS